MNENIILSHRQKNHLSCLELHQECGKKSELIVMESQKDKNIAAIYSAERYLEKGVRVLYLCNDPCILANAIDELRYVLDEEYSIGFFTAKKKTAERTDIMFATFQSLGRHLDHFSKEEFACIIVDEAHHESKKSYCKILDYFEPEYILGMTEVSNLADVKKLEKIFGEVTSYQDFVDTTSDQDILSFPIDYYVFLDEFAKIKDYLDSDIRMDIPELNHNIFTPKKDEEIVNKLLEKTTEKSKVLFFCNSIEHANHIATLIDGATVVHSYLSAQECEGRLQAFQDGVYQTIVSVDKLSKDIEFPSIDVVVFLHSACSQIAFYQQLSRGLRHHEGEKAVQVLDFVANCAHIEIIEDLQNKARQADTVSNCINIHIDTPEFQNRFDDIYSLIKKSRIANGMFEKQELMQLLHVLAKRLARIPTLEDLKNAPDMPFANAFIKRFDSWHKALVYAGLLPTTCEMHSKKYLILLLQNLAKKLGRIPTREDLKNEPYMPSARAFTKAFGSWQNALNDAGLTPPPEFYGYYYSNWKLIELLQDLAYDLDKVPERTDLENNPGFPPDIVYECRFGSWENALREAGLISDPT